MMIDVFAICWNEEQMMPNFLRHYGFARKITILDNESTDRSVEIACQDSRVAIRSWSSAGKQDNSAMTWQKNNCWRGCDADYVVVCDMDEFVDCTPLADYGAREVAFRCQGRMMIGSDGKALAEIRRYVLHDAFDKIAVFSPRICAINYGPGAHQAAPTCPIVENPRLILRHYHLLGEQYMLRRYHRYAVRMSANDRRYGFGSHYLQSDDAILETFRGSLARSIEEL